MASILNQPLGHWLPRIGNAVALIALLCPLNKISAQASGAVPPENIKYEIPSKQDRLVCKNALGGRVTGEGRNDNRNDGASAGIRGIRVKLLDAKGKLVASTVTDRDGRYAFGNLCPGTYTICPGLVCPAGGVIPSLYSPASIDIKIPPIVQTGLDFTSKSPPGRLPKDFPNIHEYHVQH